MRKLMLAAATVALVSAGVVATSSTPASAIECPYTGCVNTTTFVDAPGRIDPGTKPTVKVKVSPGSGTAAAKGTVSIKCSHDGDTKSASGNYRGPGYTAYAGPRLSKGRWDCTAKFSSDFKFKSSSAAFTIRAR